MIKNCWLCEGTGEYWYAAHGPQTTRCPICFGTGVAHMIHDKRSLFQAIDYQVICELMAFITGHRMLADADTVNAWMEIVFDVQR